MAERFGVDHIDLGVFKADMSASNLMPSSAARRYQAVPVRFMDDRTLLVAMSDPGNVLAVDDISLITGYEVRPAVATPEDVHQLVQRLNTLDDVVVEEGVDEDDQGAEVFDLRDSAEDAPVIKLVHSLIAQGVEQGASDIHFEPVEGSVHVRFRIDGVLVEATTIPRQYTQGVISRIKIMSDLDISERRVPQDGRVSMTIDGRPVDVRVATLPLVGGESAVLRVLDKEGAVIDLDKLGFQPQERHHFETAFRKPHGAVLVTGPTGSGKTTSLYGALRMLHTPEKNIITIEDPVEYEMSGIKQMQVNNRAGLGFANGLRSMMRADPDIIMVGEIRDKETAQIAVEAALTGHLVLSTLHTNDAPGRDRAPDRDGRRALPGGLRGGLRRRPAPGPAPVRALQAAGDGRRRDPAPPRLRGRGRRRRLLRAGRLPALRRHRLQGPRRPLRGHADQRGDPRARGLARVGRRDRRGRRARGHAPPAGRGHREGARRPDVVRRARARLRLTPITPGARPGRNSSVIP